MLEERGGGSQVRGVWCDGRGSAAERIKLDEHAHAIVLERVRARALPCFVREGAALFWTNLLDEPPRFGQIDVLRVGRFVVVVWICKLERRFLPQRVLRHFYLHYFSNSAL